MGAIKKKNPENNKCCSGCGGNVKWYGYCRITMQPSNCTSKELKVKNQKGICTLMVHSSIIHDA